MNASSDYRMGDKVYVETREGAKDAIVVGSINHDQLIVEFINDQPHANSATTVVYTRFVKLANANV